MVAENIEFLKPVLTYSHREVSFCLNNCTLCYLPKLPKLYHPKQHSLCDMEIPSVLVAQPYWVSTTRIRTAFVVSQKLWRRRFYETHLKKTKCARTRNQKVTLSTANQFV